MSCCSAPVKDEDNPDNSKEVADNWVDGDGNGSIKNKERGCTDIIFLLLLFGCWFAMTMLGFAAFGWIDSKSIKAGNPYRLIRATDYLGNICGEDEDVKGLDMAYYMYTGSVVCIDKCPTADDTTTFYCQYDIDVGTSTTSQLWSYVAEGKCMYAMKSNEIVWRCYPETLSAAAQAQVEAQETGGMTLPTEINPTDSESWPARFMSDVWVLRGYIFGFGLGVSVGVAFLYLMLLRIPGVLFITIWGMVLSILALLVVGTTILNNTKNTWKDEQIKSDSEITMIAVCEYIGIGLCVLYTCLILVLRKRIELALGIVEEAAKALESMPAMIFYPIVQAIGVVVFLVPWTAYMVYLASSGDIVVHTATTSYTNPPSTYSYREYNYDLKTQYAFVYLVFMWFWTSQWVVALGQLVIALSCVAWYFTRDKSTIGSGTVLWATRTTLWYHSGTAAFGSLIVAIVKTIRAILTYIQNKCAKSENRIAVAILCMLQCCLWCMEKCIKFLNKNAYIQTAIHGYNFCKSARTAFFLILRNCLRVVAVNMVADFVLMLSKIMIPSFTTTLCYLSIVYGADSHLKNEINGIISPMILCFLLSYFVAVMFVEVFGMAIETILLCYIADEEMFEPAKRFADGALHSAIQDTAASAKEHDIHHGEDHPAPSSKGCCGGGGSEPAESGESGITMAEV